jgi:hypothetical protein
VKPQTDKSLFASFSSEKEESCSFLKKRTKRLLSVAAWAVLLRFSEWAAAW